MKKIIALLVLFAGLAVHAQDATKAKVLLDKVSAKVKSYKNVEIDFNYNLQNTKEKVNQTNKGKVTLQGNHCLLYTSRCV